MRQKRFVFQLCVVLAAAIFCTFVPVRGRTAAQTSPPVSASVPGFKVLYNFDAEDIPNNGDSPTGSFTSVGSILYGMTSRGGTGTLYGTIFKFDPTANANPYSLLYSFAGGPDDGAYPYESSLRLSGRILYGMTSLGGAYSGTDNNGLGTIFSFDTAAENHPPEILHNFAGQPSDGAAPWGDLTPAGANLYGMTYSGGANNMGTVFKYDTAAPNSPGTLLHSFAGGTDGAHPYGTVTVIGTILYGTTSAGGTQGSGTIFKFNTVTNELTVLHNFGDTADDGVLPSFGFALAKTVLYGVTTMGGVYGKGTIFKYDVDSKAYKVLHSFRGGAADGDSPVGTPVVSGTMLYGTTRLGGGGYTADGAGLGTVYMFDTKKRRLALLHSFQGSPDDGMNPCGALTFLGETLYGMTPAGGANGQGTIFRTPDVPVYTISGALTGDALPDVTLTLSQRDWVSQTTTDQSGGFSFSNLVAGKYTLAPSMKGYVFKPKSAKVSLGDDKTLNFSSIPIVIKGKVTPLKGKNLPATQTVTVNLTGGLGDKVYNTQPSGYYEFEGVDGQYKITPQPPEHSAGALVFAPSSANVTIHGKNTNVNFHYKTNKTCRSCH